MEFVYNLIPEEYVERLRQSVSNEIEFLETLAFEISNGINKGKLEDCIKATEYLISLRQNLKYLIESSIKKQKPTIPICSYADHFHFEHKDIPEEDNLIIKDDEDFGKNMSLIDHNWDKKEYTIKRILKKAIKYESIKICKYLLLIITTSDMFDINASYILKAVIIKTGNIEIIRIFQQNGMNFNNIHMLTLIHSHHFDIIDWGINILGIKNNKNSIMSAHSLYFHFVNKIPFKANDIDNDDISCIIDSFVKFSKRELYGSVLNEEQMRSNIFRRNDSVDEIELDEILDHSNEQELNPTLTIIKNCRNMFYSIDFDFTLENLGCTILYDRFDMFQHILNKIDINSSPVGVTNMNILQLSIIKGNIKYIEEIIKKNPVLLYLTDSFENNIFHYSIKQESKEIFKFLENKVSKEEFIKMIQYKNNDNDSPYDLAKRYEHYDFFQ